MQLPYGWPMEPWMEVVFFFVAASPLFVALFADRFAAPRRAYRVWPAR